MMAETLAASTLLLQMKMRLRSDEGLRERICEGGGGWMKTAPVCC